MRFALQKRNHGIELDANHARKNVVEVELVAEVHHEGA